MAYMDFNATGTVNAATFRFSSAPVASSNNATLTFADGAAKAAFLDYHVPGWSDGIQNVLHFTSRMTLGTGATIHNFARGTEVVPTAGANTVTLNFASAGARTAAGLGAAVTANNWTVVAIGMHGDPNSQMHMMIFNGSDSEVTFGGAFNRASGSSQGLVISILQQFGHPNSRDSYNGGSQDIGDDNLTGSLRVGPRQAVIVQMTGGAAGNANDTWDFLTRGTRTAHGTSAQNGERIWFSMV